MALARETSTVPSAPCMPSPAVAPAMRPSLLDPWLASEPGLGPCICMPNVAVLYVQNRPVAIIQATSMDQASLDGWLIRVRSRMPRVRSLEA